MVATSYAHRAQSGGKCSVVSLLRVLGLSPSGRGAADITPRRSVTSG